MKKILTLFIAFMASTCLWAWSDFYDEESKLYYLITGNTTVEVASEAEWTATYPVNYSGSKFSIPSTVTYEGKTYRVTSIGPNAFAECKALTTITIAESVTSIQEFAFSSCPKLKSITIPNSVKSIDNTAFEFCTALSKIFVCGTREFEALSEFDVIYCDKIVDGLVISSLDNPDGYAEIIEYAGPTNITSITIPEEAEDIREGVFNQCKSLKSITWNAKKCGAYWAFDAIKQNITSFTFGDNIEHIPAGLCKGMSKLTSVTIPESVKSIGEDAFIGTGIYTNTSNWKNGALYINNCLVAVDKNATSYTIIPDTRLIAGGVFQYNSSLKSVTIPESVTAIGYGAFSGCEALTNITIPESVISIGEKAFEGCTALTTITIPESVMSIGDEAFKGTAFYDNTSNWENGALYVNNCLVAVDRNQVKKDFTIKPGTRLIAAEAFNSCDVTSIAIPNSVTSIGEGAFANCNRLTYIIIPESVTSIGGNLFGMENGSLENVYVCSSSKNKFEDLIGWGITYYDKIVDGCVISNHKIIALTDPTTITTVTIPESVTSIGVGTFSSCESLKSVTINSDKVANSANLKELFGSQVTEYIIGNSVKSIGDKAFAGCSLLTSITIPASVTSIGYNAFSRCSSLKSITIPAGVTSIGYNAFSSCESLKSVTINSDKVANSANLKELFGSQVTEYIIGSSITSIGKGTFDNCSSLESVQWNAINCTIPQPTKDKLSAFPNTIKKFTFGDNLKSIPAYICCGLSNLTSITIPDSVTSIGGFAFYDCSKLTSVNISKNLTSIEDCAFAGCSSLTSITIPDGVTSIGEYALAICESLTSITIPVSVTSIGDKAFYGCSALQTINYTGTKKQWKSIEDTNLTIEAKKQVVVICSDGEVKLKGK